MRTNNSQGLTQHGHTIWWKNMQSDHVSIRHDHGWENGDKVVLSYFALNNYKNIMKVNVVPCEHIENKKLFHLA
jgi:hypothetical protein